MQNFDITISAIVQFIGVEQTDNYTKEIFTLDLSNPKIRYVIFSLNKDNSCIVNTFYKGCLTAEKILDGKDFYTEDEDNGALPVFFREHVLQEDGLPVISRRHFLITIGHGAGFGIMTESLLKENFRNSVELFDEKSKKLSGLMFANVVMPVEKNLNDALLFAVNNFQSNQNVLTRPDNSFFEKNSFFIEVKGNSALMEAYNQSVPSIKYLTSFQLADIVKKEFSKAKDAHGFNGAPIDLVLQINCYMQSFENGYGLKDIAKYLFASEIGFPTYGMSYITFFKALSRNTEIIIQDLAEIIKRALIISRNNQQDDEGLVSFTINNLSKYEDVFIKINELATGFINSLDNVINGKRLRDHIYDVREGAINRDLDEVYLFVDLYNFLFDLQQVILPDQILADKIAETLKSFDDCVIKKYCDDVLSGNPRFPNSFGIFFPKQNRLLVSGGADISAQLVDEYLDGNLLSVFTKKQNWDDFIAQYLNPPQ